MATFLWQKRLATEMGHDSFLLQLGSFFLCSRGRKKNLDLIFLPSVYLRNFPCLFCFQFQHKYFPRYFASTKQMEDSSQTFKLILKHLLTSLLPFSKACIQNLYAILTSKQTTTTTKTNPLNLSPRLNLSREKIWLFVLTRLSHSCWESKSVFCQCFLYATPKETSSFRCLPPLTCLQGEALYLHQHGSVQVEF